MNNKIFSKNDKQRKNLMLNKLRIKYVILEKIGFNNLKNKSYKKKMSLN